MPASERGPYREGFRPRHFGRLLALLALALQLFAPAIDVRSSLSSAENALSDGRFGPASSAMVALRTGNRYLRRREPPRRIMSMPAAASGTEMQTRFSQNRSTAIGPPPISSAFRTRRRRSAS
jgi:hypothetical protein